MKKILILSFILITAVTNLKAQEVINLNQAIGIAIENNYNVDVREKNVQLNELNVSTARGNLFPDLSLNASWSRNNSFSEGTIRFQNGVPITIPKQNTWINNFTLGVQTNVTLFDGFANYQGVDLQKENVSASRIQLDQEKYDIVYNINAAYFDVLKREKIVVANDENLADSKAQLNLVTEYMNVGRRTLADVYRQDVQVAQNELNLERSKNDLSKSKVDLLLAMNTDVNKTFEIQGTDINANLSEADLKTVLDRNSNTEVLVNKAFDQRYDYRLSQQDIRISRVQFNIDQKYLYYPTLSGFASYNLNAARIGDIANSRTFSFGLQLSYYIYQGMNLSNRSQASEIQVRQREDNSKLLELQIRSEIKKAYLDLQTQYKQIEILNRNIVSAEQDKLLSEENYRVGLGTLLDAQTAATKLNTLKIDLINAYYDFLLSERRLRYYTGDLRY